MDSEKMKQVILNLLSNAVEHTPEGGRIEILTRRGDDKEDQDMVLIEVKDNGEGIPDAIINKIFDPYFSTKHKGNMQNGTGLGLFITHLNIQNHGGMIEVCSEVNKGTTFLIRLPCHPASTS